MRIFHSKFMRAQGTALVGGLIDLSCMLILKEIFGWYYVYAILTGGFIGAIVNYSLNRYWAFGARDEPKTNQVSKYAIVSLGSNGLKTLGTYVFTEFFFFDYRVARVLLDLIIAWGFNFTLMNYWVFRQRATT